MMSHIDTFTDRFDWVGNRDSFRNDWLQLLHWRVNILISVLGTVDMTRNFQYVCGIDFVSNEMKLSTFYVPPCN